MYKIAHSYEAVHLGCGLTVSWECKPSEHDSSGPHHIGFSQHGIWVTGHWRLSIQRDSSRRWKFSWPSLGSPRMWFLPYSISWPTTNVSLDLSLQLLKWGAVWRVTVLEAIFTSLNRQLPGLSGEILQPSPLWVNTSSCYTLSRLHLTDRKWVKQTSLRSSLHASVATHSLHEGSPPFCSKNTVLFHLL